MATSRLLHRLEGCGGNINTNPRVERTFSQQEIPEGDEVSELPSEWEWRAKRGHTLCRVHYQPIALCDVVVRHQGKDVVEVGTHVVGVEVQGGGLVGLSRVCVIVHEDDDHNVVADVTLALQLQ